MATEPVRDPIKRVAMLVELESGATLVLFAQPDPEDNDAQVTVTQEPVQLVSLWPAGPAKLDRLRRDVSVHVDGLHQYRMADTMPTMVRTYLDSIATAVDL